MHMERNDFEVFTKWYENDMIYVMVQYAWWINIVVIWYDEGMRDICYVTIMIYDMIGYMHDVDCYVWKHENVMIWYMCHMIDMIWLTCKMMSQHEIQSWRTHERHDKRYEKWYDMKENARRVVLNDNENEKILRLHELLCAHALGDTPSHSR